MAYVIRKDDAPVKIIFGDIAYAVKPEDCRLNAASLTGAVLNRNKIGFHKLLKYIIQGTEAWKWIEKSKEGKDSMKALREHYDGSAESECPMNITTAYLKVLYFKQHEVFPFKKYVNSSKEA